MQSINYSYNWNRKLETNYYTSIRLASDKYQVGRHLRVTLKGIYQHVAEIIEIRTISLDLINEYIAGLDTGYSAEECKAILRKMYKNSKVDIEKAPLMLILFRKNKAATDKLS